MKNRVYERAGSSAKYLEWYDDYGKRHRESAGTANDREAHRLLEVKISQVEHRKQHADSIRYKTASVEYLQSLRKEGTKETYTQGARRWHPFVHDLYLHEIDEQVFRKFINHHRGKLADQTIRISMEYMSQVLEWGGLPSPTPMLKKKLRLKPARKVTRYLTPDEEQRFLAAAPNMMKQCMFIVAMETGMRANELFGLTKDRVDLKRNLIDLSAVHTKTDQPRLIPLSARAKQALNMAPMHNQRAYVFWHSDGERYLNAGTWWTEWRERTGIQDFRWHDLRHTFARRWLVDGHGDIATLSVMMGHSRLEMTMRYVAWVTDDLRTKLDRVEGTRVGTALPIPMTVPNPTVRGRKPGKVARTICAGAADAP